MATKKELLRRMAALESMNDQLLAELAYLDRLMRQIGFSDGLKSVKETALEIMHNDEPEHPKKPGDSVKN